MLARNDFDHLGCIMYLPVQVSEKPVMDLQSPVVICAVASHVFVNAAEIRYSGLCISELMELLIDCHMHGMEISQVEGDDVPFYKVQDERVLSVVLQQAEKMLPFPFAKDLIFCFILHPDREGTKIRMEI